MKGISYFDVCPECDSMNVRVTEELDGGMLLVFCYDCGASWEDVSEL